MFRVDSNTDNMAKGIGFSLAVMLSLIGTTIPTLVFGDIKREDLFDLMIILIAAPVLLMIKAYHSESLKNSQHPFFTNKLEKIKTVLFFVIAITILFGIYAH